jgi:hypothetical protein
MGTRWHGFRVAAAAAVTDAGSVTSSAIGMTPDRSSHTLE